jgi:hypothetical protein
MKEHFKKMEEHLKKMKENFLKFQKIPRINIFSILENIEIFPREHFPFWRINRR